MIRNRSIVALTVCAVATAFTFGLSHSETKKEARRSTNLSSTASRPTLTVTAAQLSGPLTPADFLVLDHGKNKNPFGSRSITTISEIDLGTVTLGDLSDFPVVYFEPDWSSYSELTTVMGELTAYVNGGGILVVNIAGHIGSLNDIAPGGVDYDRTTTHESESIVAPGHLYITGGGYNGSTLVENDFSSWNSTDHGILTDLPPNATVILQSADGPSLVEYAIGSGCVLVSTLTYGWVGPEAPHANLIDYAFLLSTPIAITNQPFTDTSPATITGYLGPKSNAVRVTVQVREETPVDATLDTQTQPFTFTQGNVVLNEGPNRVIATGFTAGNDVVAADTTTITLDTEAPTIAITSPTNNSSQEIVSNSLLVTGEVSDDNLHNVHVNGTLASVAGGIFSATISASGGSNQISAVATDRAGNTGTSSPVTVDITILSPNLISGDGFLYDVSTVNGSLNDGGNTTPGQESSDAFDDWGFFKINGSEYRAGSEGGGGGEGAPLVLEQLPATLSFEDNGRELVLPAVTIDDLNVYRKIYVPATGPGFARFINAVHNPTGAPVTVELSFDGDLGSDSGTELQGTSSGSQSSVMGGTDTWFVTDDEDLSGDDAALAHVFDGAGGVDQADSVFYEQGGDEPAVIWKEVTIEPGETAIYLFFEAQRNEASQALAAADYIDDVPSALFEGMTEGELLAVRNFPTGPVSTAALQLGLPYSSETNPPFQTPGFGVPGDTLWIPVYLTINGGPASGGVQFSVTHSDLDKTEPHGFRLSPALQALGFEAGDNTLNINGETPAVETRVIIFSDGETDENGDPIGVPEGETYLGSAVYFLKGVAQLGETYNLELTDVLVGDQNGNPINVPGIDNSDLHVGIRGDINLDAGLNIFDVIQLVRILIGRMETQGPGATDWLIADFNGNGNLDIADLIGLINRILGIQPTAKVIAGTPATVALGEAYPLSDGRLAIPVLFDNASAIAGAQLALTFDQSRVRVGSPLLTSRTGGMTMDSHIVDGTMQIVLYSLSPGINTQPGTGVVLVIPISPIGGDNGSALTLASVVLADVSANLLPVSFSESTVRTTALPDNFALMTATPNPFNPSTTIAYETPQQAHVTLTVYNLLGQEVIRLVDEVKAAGRYSVTWNGQNARGLGVASGVYLYRLTSAAGSSELKRMTLLK